MNSPRTLGTEEWYAANPKKFAVYNSHYDESGALFITRRRLPWVAAGGDYFRRHETFEEALNYALDKAALI